MTSKSTKTKRMETLSTKLGILIGKQVVFRQTKEKSSIKERRSDHEDKQGSKEQHRKDAAHVRSLAAKATVYSDTSESESEGEIIDKGSNEGSDDESNR